MIDYSTTSLPVLCLFGPTGSGKTALALSLAEQVPCEIISVDSAQVYRGMDIGTAKPDHIIRNRIPHHLIDICDVTTAYSAAQFQTDATTLINDIRAHDRIPLLVGGTMLYFRALLFGLSALPSANPSMRAELTQRAATIGWPAMHAWLADVDPDSAERIHPSDTQRIQRALEVYLTTGKTRSAYWQDDMTCQTPPPWPIQCISLQPNTRALLHQRIATRFQTMLADGLIDEVEQFYQRDDVHADLPAMRSVGYRQVWQYLAGEIDHARMVDAAIIATRQLAKRQLTWLRHWPTRDPIEQIQIDSPETLSLIIKGITNKLVD